MEEVAVNNDFTKRKADAHKDCESCWKIAQNHLSREVAAKWCRHAHYLSAKQGQLCTVSPTAGVNYCITITKAVLHERKVE